MSSVVSLLEEAAEQAWLRIVEIDPGTGKHATYEERCKRMNEWKFTVELLTAELEARAKMVKQ